MIENTAMSNDADELAKEADFISIGTNDLTESVTGLSRDTNSKEFQEVRKDYIQCRNLVSNITWLISDLLGRFKQVRNY